MAITKTKVSLTISTELLQQVDREARRLGTTRSAMFERYVRGSATRAAERSLDEMTATYYNSLTAEERAESEAIARASSRAAKAIPYDVPVRRGPRRKVRG